MTTQDFSRKITICVRGDLPSWQVLNTVGHICAYFGNVLGDTFGTAPVFTTEDGFVLPRNSQLGIVILAAQEAQLADLIVRADEAYVHWMAFTRQMIDALDDNEIQTILAKTKRSELEYLGVGLLGEKNLLKDLTKNFHLWK